MTLDASSITEYEEMAAAIEREYQESLAEIRRLNEGLAKRIEADLQSKKARDGEPRCLHRCRGTPCERRDGHKGLHLTTTDGGAGWWATKHSDPPNAWALIAKGELL